MNLQLNIIFSLLKLKNHLNNIVLTFISLVKILFLSKWLKVLKHKTTKKSCVIIGNGPSFTESIRLYKEKIIEHELICVNSFANTEFYENLKPNYYLLQAPILFQSNEKSSELYINYRDVLFKNILDKTSWELNLMVPFRAKKSPEFLQLILLNKNIKPLYFNDVAIEGFSFFKTICFKLKLGIPRPHNVLIPSLFNSMNIGFKTIHIIGADHSWLSEISVNNQNEALVNQKHFYDENTSRPQKMEDYITRPRKLHEIIHKFYLSFRGYWEVEEFANKQKIKIYNCSEKSMIDAFQRGNLKDI